MSIITWNPNDKSKGATLSNNNLTFQNDVTDAWVRATDGRLYGKWYWEVRIDQFTRYHAPGVVDRDELNIINTNDLDFYRYYSVGEVRKGTIILYNVDSFYTGDIIGILLDMIDGKLGFTKNGNLVCEFIDIDTSKEMFPVMWGGYSVGRSTANFGATKFDIVDSNPKLWNQLVNDGYKPYDINNADWLYCALIKSNNKYYTYQNNEFIEVGPTVENFEENFVSLSQLTTPTDRVVIPMEGGEELEDGRLYRKTIVISKYKDIERIRVNKGE